MPMNKSGVESIVAQKMEEWSAKLQTHYDEKFRAVYREQKETLTIVNRLGKYVNNLEIKVNFLSSHVKRHDNGEGNSFLDRENDQSLSNLNKNDDLVTRIRMLENFCGYDPEKEAYAALEMGTGELLRPENKLNSRVESLEDAIAKLSRNIRHVENDIAEINSVDPLSGKEGIVTNGFFLPEKNRPKTSQGDYRQSSSKDNHFQASNGRHVRGYSGTKPSTTPYPPSHNGTFGHRSAPPNNKSRVVTKPTTAANYDSRNNMQKFMDEIRSQIKEVDDKNNIHNTFLMNELMENVNSQEEKTDRKLYGLDAKLRKYVADVEKGIRNDLSEVEKSLKKEITDVTLQQEAVVRAAKEANGKNIDEILTENENNTIELQDLRRKELDWQMELKSKENELRNLILRKESTESAYTKLQEEAEALKEANERLKDDHITQIKQLEKEFEERRNIVDEKTELYKAETQRLKKIHEELQQQVNIEIKQKITHLENEKQDLEKKLTDEMSIHNIQSERDRVIRDTLQRDIEMYKRSCTEANNEKERILAELKATQARYANLQAKLDSFQHTNVAIPMSPKNLFDGIKDKHSPSPSKKDDSVDEDDGDTFESPVSRINADLSIRRNSFQRTDTPIPTKTRNFFRSNSSDKSITDSKKSDTPQKPAVKRIPSQEVQKEESTKNHVSGNDKDDKKIQEKLQRNLSQNDIDDIVMLEELIREKETELEHLTAAKSRAKKKIKNWINDFQKANGRPPNQEEKENVSELYMNHQQVG